MLEDPLDEGMCIECSPSNDILLACPSASKDDAVDIDSMINDQLIIILIPRMKRESYSIHFSVFTVGSYLIAGHQMCLHKSIFKMSG